MKYLIVVLGVIAMIVGLSLLLTYPVMWAINYTFAPSFLVYVFGAAKLTFWKTFVLELVTSSLFKSYNYNSK